MKAESKQIKNSRWYKCPKCGEDHPSVTTLLGVISSRALMGWMAKNGTAKLDIYHQSAAEHLNDETIGAIDKIAEQRWLLGHGTAFWKSGKIQGEEAADVGTLAHAWIEAHLQGKDVDLEALPPGAQNAVKAFLEWKNAHHFKMIKTEQTFYNCGLHYAGTVDCIAEVDGELTLFDWKTAKSVYTEMAIQAWSYALADESSEGKRLYRQVGIGRFGKDGLWEVRIFKRNEFPSIEVARNIMQACGHIFALLQEWDKKFPYNASNEKK